MSESFVLDSSALLALINNEAGALSVEPLISQSIISAINFAETLSILERHGIKTKEGAHLLRSMIKDIIPFTTEHAIISSEIYLSCQLKGLSLGDRACLALGLSENLPVVTADRAWKDLSLNLEIRCIR